MADTICNIPYNFKILFIHKIKFDHWISKACCCFMRLTLSPSLKSVLQCICWVYLLMS